MDRKARPAAIHGVARSRTWLSNWSDLITGKVETIWWGLPSLLAIPLPGAGCGHFNSYLCLVCFLLIVSLPWDCELWGVMLVIYWCRHPAQGPEPIKQEGDTWIFAAWINKANLDDTYQYKGVDHTCSCFCGWTEVRHHSSSFALPRLKQVIGLPHDHADGGLQRRSQNS